MTLQGEFWRFSDNGREFSFKRRDLKETWQHFISTDALKLIISEHGNGPSFGRSNSSDSLLSSKSPRLVFVRDQDTGEVWTVNGTDSAEQPADWTCTHGFGYTRLSSTTHEIAGSVTYFVPTEDAVEVWRIRLENTGSRPRRLRVFSLALWDLGLRGYSPLFEDVSFTDDMIVADCHHWPLPAPRSTLAEHNRAWDRVGFMSSSPRPSGFDCVYNSFVGEFTNMARADAVQDGECRNSVKRGADNCGALQMDVEVESGATADLVVLVGMAEDRDGVARVRAKYETPELADAAFEGLKQWWADYLDRMHIELPDRDIESFTNGWNFYAAYTRYCHFPGVRDTAQDMAVFCAIDPDRAKRRIKEINQSQFRDGCTHQHVDELGRLHHRSINSDVPLWIPWVSAKYIRETGDYTLLDEMCTYQDGGEGTIYEHCVKAIDHIHAESGRYGLPFLRCGDWNDCLMGSSKTGVSVWLAIFYHINLMEMHELAARTGKTEDAERFLAQARELEETINDKCWDGRWYLRAFDDDGGVIGGHTEEEGRIYLNPQTWAIMAGIAPADRALTSMEAVEELMDTPVGLPMLAPYYTKPQERIGVISRMMPGSHHNGGVWNHASTWAVIAECRIGRQDRALELYRRMLPPYLSQKWEDHRSAPYAFASYTNTPQSGETGRTGVAGITGTICWLYRAVFEGFAGVTPEFDGLRIDPRLPSEWRTIGVKRPYRGSVYNISIESLSGVSQGVKELYVNGKRCEGNVVPIQPAGQEVDVKVVL